MEDANSGKTSWKTSTSPWLSGPFRVNEEENKLVFWLECLAACEYLCFIFVPVVYNSHALMWLGEEHKHEPPFNLVHFANPGASVHFNVQTRRASARSRGFGSCSVRENQCETFEHGINQTQACLVCLCVRLFGLVPGFLSLTPLMNWFSVQRVTVRVIMTSATYRAVVCYIYTVCESECILTYVALRCINYKLSSVKVGIFFLSEEKNKKQKNPKHESHFIQTNV